MSFREVTGCIICVREIGLEFRFKRLLFIHVFRTYIEMDTRSVIEGPSHGGRIRQDYRERITVSGVERYVMITSRMDLHEGSRTISIQSISMSPTDHWDLVEKLPEIFSRFSAQNFGDFQSLLVFLIELLAFPVQTSIKSDEKIIHSSDGRTNSLWLFLRGQSSTSTKTLTEIFC